MAPYGENRGHSPYPPEHQYGAPPAPGAGYGEQQPGQYGQPGAPGEPADGERGLGSTLLGGAGGAFVGHKLGGGPLGTIGGLVAGAIGANVLDHKHDK